MPIIEGTYGPLIHPGTVAPVAGTDEVQTITIDATGGTFRLGFDGHVTAAISWSAVNNTLFANVDAALGALPSVGGAANVTVAVGVMTAGVGTMTVTFVAALGKKAVPLLTVVNNSLTGTGTLTIAETTPGITATGYGAATGALLHGTGSGANAPKVYQNTGTPAAPTWTAQT